MMTCGGLGLVLFRSPAACELQRESMLRRHDESQDIIISVGPTVTCRIRNSGRSEHSPNFSFLVRFLRGCSWLKETARCCDKNTSTRSLKRPAPA